MTRVRFHPQIAKPVIPVFVLNNVPGAAPEETVEWTSICHRKTGGNEDYVCIWHDPRRQTSRWVSEERKRPFAVCWNGRLSEPWSRHATLAAARKAAKQLAAAGK